MRIYLSTMGAILTRLQKHKPTEVFIDFQQGHMPPTNNQTEQYNIYNHVQHVLNNKQDILNLLYNYKPCTDVIRIALSQPTIQNELNAFNELLSNISIIYKFYQYNQQIQTVTPKLLHILSVQKSETTNAFNTQKSLVYQLCDLLSFILKFDIQRIQKPSLSNDFFYYKRVINKFNNDPRIVVTEDMINNIHQYLTLPCPMLYNVSEIASQTLQQNQYVSVTLYTIANVCCELLQSNDKQYNNDTIEFIIYTMTCSLVIYDHIDITNIGVFNNKCPANTYQCIKLIKNKYINNNILMNVLQYSTKHYNNATTKIKQLIES